MVERTELTLCQRLRSESEVHLPRGERRKPRPEQLICRRQCIFWPESRQSVENNIGRRVESRTGQGEDIRTRGPRGKRETEEEEENDCAKEDIQCSRGRSWKGTGRLSRCDDAAYVPDEVNGSWNEDGGEEDEERLDTVRVSSDRI